MRIRLGVRTGEESDLNNTGIEKALLNVVFPGSKMTIAILTMNAPVGRSSIIVSKPGSWPVQFPVRLEQQQQRQQQQPQTQKQALSCE